MSANMKTTTTGVVMIIRSVSKSLKLHCRARCLTSTRAPCHYPNLVRYNTARTVDDHRQGLDSIETWIAKDGVISQNLRGGTVSKRGAGEAWASDYTVHEGLFKHSDLTTSMVLLLCQPELSTHMTRSNC